MNDVKGAAGLNQGGSKSPSLRIVGQYVKDLSFENPHAPGSLIAGESPPEIGVTVNVNARPISHNDFEVEIKLEAKAMGKEEKVLFVAELCYAGVFRLENIPPEIMQPMLVVECPRLIFPFARQILSDITQNGGFPPVMLDPVDFGLIYHRRLQNSAPIT